ncbi:hypothetical protein SBOR_6949 [Sclerotinia borealis F-4128]|uniref:Uncharacterized protein n=1 Tax=Sclerotinia borealis (strain F-4128) TaxID=1432307 RepID=W9CA62_SCLBF|nr:hypothetical protein SBOR_6949 [Sclerotinia borealis F-4128]
MAILKNDILPAGVYNTLPYINDVTQIPHDNAADISDLKQLLVKYKLPDNVRIRLVHIHFKLEEGEVFAARDVKIPKHGTVNIMQAIPVSQNASLYGYHFYVDKEGNLSAYEYMEAPGPDISEQRAFLEEFCQLVQDRGLQHKLGLSIRHAENDEVPLPYNERSFETMTEFLRDLPVVDSEKFEAAGDLEGIKQITKSHTHHKHCGHTDSQHNDNRDGLSDGASASDQDVSDYGGKDGLFVTDGLSREIILGGSKLENSSELFEIVSWFADEA